MTLTEAILAAAETLRAAGEWRVISPVTVGELAAAHGRPRWEVEAAALDAEVVPLHTMRNIARFGMEGQARLLRTVAAVVGDGAVVATCLQRLAGCGVGRVRLLTPVTDGETRGQGDKETRRRGDSDPSHRTNRSDPSEPRAESQEPRAAAVARMVANVNASVATEVGAIALRQGDPTAALRGAEIVAACLEDAGDEMLLQTACRRLELTLVCAGIEEHRGQATTILPGDATLSKLYRPEHPHLERARPGSSRVAGQAALMVGAWMADQIVAALLQTNDMLRHRLLFADIAAGEIQTYEL